MHTKHGQALELDRPVDLIGAYCEVPTSTVFEEVLQRFVLIHDSFLLYNTSWTSGCGKSETEYKYILLSQTIGMDMQLFKG